MGSDLKHKIAFISMDQVSQRSRNTGFTCIEALLKRQRCLDEQ